jgi:hypothetical protein
MIDILYGVGLLGAIVVGYLAWKGNWKIVDIF